MRYDVFAAKRKKRIIQILQAAAESSDPAVLIPQVLKMRSVWAEAGDTGKHAGELAEAYIRAKTQFWMRVEASQREPAKAAA